MNKHIIFSIFIIIIIFLISIIIYIFILNFSLTLEIPFGEWHYSDENLEIIIYIPEDRGEFIAPSGYICEADITYCGDTYAAKFTYFTEMNQCNFSLAEDGQCIISSGYDVSIDKMNNQLILKKIGVRYYLWEERLNDYEGKTLIFEKVTQQ